VRNVLIADEGHSFARQHEKLKAIRQQAIEQAIQKRRDW